MFSTRKQPICMLVRPPAGYGTGNKPNIKEGLYLLPQALPCLARVIEKKGGLPIVVDLEVNRWSIEQFISEFQKTAPDIVLFTVTTSSFCYCEKMAAAIKQITDDVPIIFGGPHATYEWQSILANRIADIVVLNEGESAVSRIMDCLKEGNAFNACAGIAYVDESGVPVRTQGLEEESLNLLELPGYEYLNMKAYKEHVGKCTLEVLRGCPHGCKFCLNTKYYRNVRRKLISSVEKEVNVLVGHYGFEKLSIISPELISSSPYVIELLDTFESLLSGTNVTWACASTAMSLSKAILKKMARAHCRSIFIGIESGTDEVQRLSGEKLKLSALQERLLMVRDAGIDVLASFIIGLPGETEASAMRTIELAVDLKGRHEFIKTIQFNTFGPFPGTDFREESLTYGCQMLPIDFAYYTVVPAVNSDLFPAQAHYSLWHEVWKHFFPNYYDEYLEIERAALSGKNPRLEAFMRPIDLGLEVNRPSNVDHT